jgi:hypothetical protein
MKSDLCENVLNNIKHEFSQIKDAEAISPKVYCKV